MKLKMKQQLLYSIIIGATTSIIIIIILSLSINSASNEYREKEKLEVLERFISFQSNAEKMLSENTNLLKGYLAYIETNLNISEEDTNRYLNRLLSKQLTMIRNIGIIKNTTIIWNYPKETNKKAIGVDLTKIPNQINDLLKVKNTLKPLFMGPVDLIQGDRGFIARLPIVTEEQYWGQISIVLDADQYINELERMAKESELNIAIFNEEDYPHMPFYGDIDIIKRNKNVLDMEMFNSNWKIVIEPLGGWDRNIAIINGAKVIAIIVSLIIGFFLFMLINTSFRLKNQAMNDYLTQLHTRNYLGYYYNIIFKKADINKDLIGVFLLDINSFKRINDSYGHKIGDLVLIEFAKRLQSVRVDEKKVFRLGGDEFLIVVPGYKDLKDLKYVERKIKAESFFRFKHDTIDIDIVPSIGFAAYPMDGQTLDEIIHIADLRMYEVKKGLKEKTKKFIK